MKNLIFICALVLLTTSCATIFNGTKETITFKSTPSGADVKVVNKKGIEQSVGVTPCTVPVSKQTTEVKFSKNNYYSESYFLRQNAKINAWYYVDLAGTVLGLVGLPSTIVDLSTGAVYDLPNNVSVELKKKQ
jgi:hypothetical protein